MIERHRSSSYETECRANHGRMLGQCECILQRQQLDERVDKKIGGVKEMLCSLRAERWRDACEDCVCT
jgi:hypothetical protein